MYSYVNPAIQYVLFFCSFLFWVFSLLILGVGVYAKVEKTTDTVRDKFLIDPAVVLMVVGVVVFFITFCGCIGALRQNISLLRAFTVSLTLVFLTQLGIAVLAFVYSDQARETLGRFVKKAVVHYRDDLDLQNLMDFMQMQFKCCGWNSYSDWSWNLYFNCTLENPSLERCAVPYSCCTPDPEETVINTMCGFSVQTLTFLQASESIHAVGCADRAVLWMESHLLLVGAAAMTLALPQVRLLGTLGFKHNRFNPPTADLSSGSDRLSGRGAAVLLQLLPHAGLHLSSTKELMKVSAAHDSFTLRLQELRGNLGAFPTHKHLFACS